MSDGLDEKKNAQAMPEKAAMRSFSKEQFRIILLIDDVLPIGEKGENSGVRKG